MKEIVKIHEVEGQPAVNARNLHEYLESKQEFSNWIKGKIEKYGFIAGTDFLIILSESTGGRPATDYFLSLDMAKELAMVENNEKGRAIRRYFILIEKAYKREVKERGKIRDKSKEVRRQFTDTLKERGYTKQYHFIQTTKQMKEGLGIKNKKEDMNKIELKKVMAAELLSEINIEQTDAMGYSEVNPICVKSCQSVITATEAKKQIA